MGVFLYKISRIIIHVINDIETVEIGNTPLISWDRFNAVTAA